MSKSFVLAKTDVLDERGLVDVHIELWKLVVNGGVHYAVSDGGHIWEEPYLSSAIERYKSVIHDWLI